ncbi:MAG: hypothetical protein ACTSWD_06220 [Candidatus Heimdallarchaeota archaeon]
MSLVSMTDVEITPGKKMTDKSVIVKRAIQLIRQRKQTTREEFEDVINPFELIVACYEVMGDYEKRCSKSSKTNHGETDVERV